MDENGVEATSDGKLYLKHTDEGCEVPDVPEGDAGKLTAPVDGDTDAAEGSVDDVAEALPQIEAFV